MSKKRYQKRKTRLVLLMRAKQEPRTTTKKRKMLLVVKYLFTRGARPDDNIMLHAKTIDSVT